MEERLTHMARLNALISHDGIHDAQTHLATPSFFYEQLKRETAISERSQQGFSAIRILFTGNIAEAEDHGNFDEAVINFAFELKSMVRSQDFIARMGVHECIVLISDNQEAALQLFARLLASPSLSINNALHLSMALVSSQLGESGLELLNRLDKAALSTH